MNKVCLLVIFLAGSLYTYAQEKNIIDVIIESYEAYFSLIKNERNERIIPNTIPNHPIDIPREEKPVFMVKPICPPEPEDFYYFFDTYFIDFASLKEGGVNTFSFSDSLHLPLKYDLIVTSDYGMRGNRKHYGVDFRLNVGDTVCSVFCGKVRIAKWDSSYGYVVVVRHYNMSETVYAHLSRILVTVDQEVNVGESIGLGGSTGRSKSPHLHFELRYKGFPINPIVDYRFLSHIPVY